MRFLIFLVLLGFLSSAVGAFHCQESASYRSASHQKRGLELTTSVVERKYCSTGGMLLILRSIYKNTSEDNVILFKYSLAPFEYRISRDLQSAKAKDYEQVISPTMGSNSIPIEFGDQPTTDYFVVLKPGQSYAPVNSFTVPIFISEQGKEVSRDRLRPGQHVLQVRVSTWPFHNNSEAELQTRWQRFGILWTEPVLSSPMTFLIDNSHLPLSDCNASDPKERRAK